MENMNKNSKRRERIKTILIIFLLIILLLTFFSNSIMNHSLPTVSAQYASYGTITEKVRGSGIVAANQNYEITAEGNRKIASISIKQGDEVKTGDTLFVLEASEDEEMIKAAESAIEEAELAYQKALLTAVPDYASQNQDIANARADLQNATRKLNDAKREGGSSVSESAYQQAKAKAKTAAKRITELTGYQSMIASGELDGLPAEYISGLNNAKAALDTANDRVSAAQASVDAAQSVITVSSADQETAIRSLERAAESADMAYDRAKADYDASAGDTDLRRAMEDAQQTARYAHEDVEKAKKDLTDIQAKEAALALAREEMKAAESDQKAVQNTYNTAVSGVSTLIQADLDTASRDADDAAAIVETYESQSGGSDIAALEDAVTASERALQAMLTSLSQTMKDDALTQQLNDLDLESQRKAIEKQKTDLQKLKKDSGTVTIKSRNDGIVSNVNFAAGDEVTDGAVLATLMLTGSGYTLQFNVSSEQARKVQAGVKADVTNNYYGDISAVLISSKADTSNPAGSDRVLTFEISGKDVTAGDMLALSIPCSSQSYDCVVPTSAINEDKDGKFLLVVQSKSTPLGNRYYAARANITVLASDEVNSAVQGDVKFSDFVITTSEKPIKPGNQVRMED